MAKKVTKKTTTVKPKLAPVKPIKSIPPRPTIKDASNMAKRVLESMKQMAAEKAEDRPRARQKVTEYIIKLEDGSVLFAEGRHADVMVQFLEECENICTGQSFAIYGGPPLTRFTAEEWAARQA